MTLLILAAALFAALHLFVSGTRLRDALVSRLGEGGYLGAFSLASVGTLVGLVLAFAHARGSAGDLEWWGATPATRHIALGLVAVAYLLAVPGLLTPNPTSVKGEGTLDREEPAQGMVRITRHPFLWGVAIWAFAHLLTNGDAASVVLFGTLAVMGLFGPWSIDHKRARVQGARWAPFRDCTSSIPFAAILQGRQRLSLKEIGLWRPATAVGLYVATILAHPYAFGANPLG